MSERLRTIVDVVEGVLGDLSRVAVESLDVQTIEQLAQAVVEFYDSWEAPPPSDGRVYSGGWIAGNFQGGEPRRYLLTSLLYFPEAVIHEPLADWFFPHRDRLWAPPGIWSAHKRMRIDSSEPTLLAGNGYFRFVGEPERTRTVLKAALPALAGLASLIRAGSVRPVPQWWIVHQHQHPLQTAVRHDVRDPEFASVVGNPIDLPVPRADQVRGMGVEPEGGWSSGDARRALSQDPSYFLNKTMLIQQQSGALYVPPAATDAALLDLRLRRSTAELARKGVELVIVPSLMSAQLPFLDIVDVATLVAIRENEEAFEDWRRSLRSAVRQVRAIPTDGTAFQDEARQVLEDALLPEATAVARRSKTSAVLRDDLSDRLVDLGVGAAALGAGTLAGAPVDPLAFAALGVSAATLWAISPLLASRAHRHSVLATLVRRSSS